MIAIITGKLLVKDSTEVIIDCGGVGYQISTSLVSIDKMPAIGNQLTLHTYLHVREDIMQLFGFYTPDEKAAFLKLTAVNGIGPKMALGILSSISVADLQSCLVSGDIKQLCRLPGIGKKTAERMVLELKDKFNILSSLPSAKPAAASDAAEHEALSALQALGYSQSVATKAISGIIKSGAAEEYTAETLIKMSLKKLMGG